MNRSLTVWHTIAVAAFAFVQISTQPLALAGNHTKSSPPDLVATAVKAGSFKTLAKALAAADLVEALRGDGPFTVLAPTDEAFAKLPAGTLAALLQPENKAKLQAILKYHVLAGRVNARQVAGLESAKTLGGEEVKIALADGQLRVNQARVLKTDIAAANGVIHVLDDVLLPPDATATAEAGSPSSLVRLAFQRGVPFYNAGNPQACAAVYEVAARSLLGRNDVSEKSRQRLNRALADSAKLGDWSERAWALRHALDGLVTMHD
jgi:uncharacterized surface protein with fasciclin (FAS1) repeats